jgi:CheY-like chemotaxis protein
MNPTPRAADAESLSGLRVLVVEDMFLIAEDIARQLADWGCHVVGPDGHVSEALERIEASELDGALLDVNLHGESSFGVATALAARHVPFIFMTGYDGQTAFPSEFQSSPKLAKPVSVGNLAVMMGRHFVRHG